MSRKDVLAAFRATGKGWQTRMNAALREWLQPILPFEAAWLIGSVEMPTIQV